MNIWKISTVALVLGLAFVTGKDVLSQAHAATGGAEQPAGLAFEWGHEQPHMEQALRDLREARHSLEIAAEHNGGWRVLALKHTDEAINETIRGMEYAKGHPKE
jgi:hypothetical protein